MFTPKPLTPLWIALPAGYAIIAVLTLCGGGVGLVTSYWVWSVTTMVLTAGSPAAGMTVRPLLVESATCP